MSLNIIIYTKAISYKNYENLHSKPQNKNQSIIRQLLIKIIKYS